MGYVDGKVAVITGAARGVGFGIAQEMADAGARVAIADLDQDQVDEACAQIGDAAAGFVADVTNVASLEQLYTAVTGQFGGVDAVVANAGVGDGAPLGKITEKQYDFITGVNLKGVLFTVQTALPHLHAGSSVVVIGSTASIQAQEGMSVYAATKAGLRMMVKTWIKDAAGSGIRFNMLSPGAIDTPSLRNAFATASGEENVEANVKRMGESNPLGRLGSPAISGKPPSSWPRTSPASSPVSNCLLTAASRSQVDQNGDQSACAARNGRCHHGSRKRYGRS